MGEQADTKWQSRRRHLDRNLWMTVQEPTQALQAGTTMSLPPSRKISATVMARAIATRPHPGGKNSLFKTNDHPSHKLSKRQQRERSLHEIIRKHAEVRLRRGPRAPKRGRRGSSVRRQDHPRNGALAGMNRKQIWFFIGLTLLFGGLILLPLLFST